MSILFPKCLYGQSIDTRAAWRDVIARLWPSPDWPSAFDAIELLPVEENPGAIILEDGYGLTGRNEDHWRLHWITALPPIRIDYPMPRTAEPMDEARVRAVVHRHRDFILEGLRRPWFAAPMLYSQALHSSPAVCGPPEETGAFARSVLGRLGRHFPVIQSLLPRLATGGSSVMTWSDAYSYPAHKGLMWKNVFYLLHLSGHGFDMPSICRELESRDHDVVGWLVDQGLFRQAGGAYEFDG
jgi:hypothetical protein